MITTLPHVDNKSTSTNDIKKLILVLSSVIVILKVLSLMKLSPIFLMNKKSSKF